MRNYSENANVIVALCSTLLPRRGMMELSAAEWDVAARRLYAQGMQPQDVPGLSDADIRQTLGFEPARIRQLLERLSAIPFEYERLSRRHVHIVTRADRDYPRRLKERLLSAAPPFFYYCGDTSLAATEGIAVTGSRKLDALANDFALEAGVRVAKEGYTLYAGGADGTDNITEPAALRLGGRVVSYIAGSLDYKLSRPETVALTREGRLLLMTTVRPDVLFAAELAPPRNKCIYASSVAAIVVSSDNGKGVAWEGATECLRNGWVPVFVRRAENPKGNNALAAYGAVPVDDLGACTLRELVTGTGASVPAKQQTSLFGLLDR